MSAEQPVRQFVCMKWGKAYGPHYVNVLYAMVRRNIEGPIRFVCLTDDGSGLRPEVEAKPCPTVDLPPTHRNLPWRKISLWGPSLPDMDGDWLFLDLDVVVTGPLEDFFTYQPDKTFLVMKNATQPGSGIGNTSVFRFRVGSHPYLLQNLEADPQAVFTKYRNSQTYTSREITEMTFWPDGWCALFKVDCVPPLPQRWWQEPPLPAGARVVAFPGSPNPDEAMAGRWPTKWYKRFYKTCRPARWIADHWHE